MEKIQNLDGKQSRDLPDWLKKLKNYGLASAVAMSSFFVSCENSGYDTVKDYGYEKVDSKETSDKEVANKLSDLKQEIDSFYFEVEKTEHYSENYGNKFDRSNEHWGKDSTGRISGGRNFDIPDSHDQAFFEVTNSKNDSTIYVTEYRSSGNSSGTKGMFNSTEFIIKNNVYNKIFSFQGVAPLNKGLEEAKDNNAKIAFIAEVEKKVQEIKNMYEEDRRKSLGETEETKIDDIRKKLLKEEAEKIKTINDRQDSLINAQKNLIKKYNK